MSISVIFNNPLAVLACSMGLAMFNEARKRYSKMPTNLPFPQPINLPLNASTSLQINAHVIKDQTVKNPLQLPTCVLTTHPFQSTFDHPHLNIFLPASSVPLISPPLTLDYNLPSSNITLALDQFNTTPPIPDSLPATNDINGPMLNVCALATTLFVGYRLANPFMKAYRKGKQHFNTTGVPSLALKLPKPAIPTLSPLKTNLTKTHSFTQHQAPK